MAYGFSEEQANIISDKEKESNFDILIAELNEKIKTKKLSVRNSIGYLVGVYQKKEFYQSKNNEKIYNKRNS
ncbi:hypothetical protein [Riemerella anatipestifer]|uniref:hypothetical protein n=1 Tax=Riemerella anatipestifer TaxID=34085 RepID=UPI001CB8C85B|nr:hypothetical protein [Riemerella anatipestifer]